jgi:hypothetical protein
MTKASSWFAMLSFVLLILLSSTAYSQMNEKAQLRDSFFGDFTKAKIEKKMGKSTLQVWDTHIKYSNTLPPLMKEVMLHGVEKLQVEYDEIWKIWKSQLDRTTLYWRDNKIQACTLEKFYLGDPSTGTKLSAPSYKVVNVYDRAYIMSKSSVK